MTNYSTFKIAQNPTRGDRAITMNPVADAATYSAGDIIALWGEEGYSTASTEFRSAFTQLVKVRSVDAGTGVVTLEDTIYKTYSGSEFRVTTGTGALDTQGPSNGFTKDIEFGNLSVWVDPAGGNETWTRYGGTYNAYIHDVNVIESRTIWTQNGFAKSIVENVRGKYRRRPYEMSIFCNDSVYRFGSAEAVNTDTDADLKLIFINEGAHHNTLSWGTVTHIDDQTAVSVPTACIDIANGSFANKVISGNIIVDKATNLLKIENAQSADMIHDGNLVAHVNIYARECDTMLGTTAVANTTRTGTVVANCVFECDTLNTNVISIDSSGVHVVNDNIFNNPSTQNITVTTTSVDNKIRGNTFKTVPTNNIAAGASCDYRSNTLVNDALQRAFVQYGATSNITSDDSTNTIGSITRTIPAGTLQADDSIEVEIWAVCAGANDVKNIALRINSTNYATYTTSSGYADGVQLWGGRGIPGTAVPRFYLSAIDTGGGSHARNGPSIDVDATDLVIELAVWVGNTSDNIRIERFNMTPKRVGFYE
jgi:hypothetical protein